MSDTIESIVRRIVREELAAMPKPLHESRRALRKRHGMTIHELAARAGVTANTVCNAENGGNIKRTTIQAIANALGEPDYERAF
jgi:transcriptional regulator with XRE-family HTH domain